MPRPAALLALLFVTTACADATAGGGNLDHAPAFTLAETLRMGSVEDPEVGFSAPGPVDVDADGNIYVFERGDLEIRVFDPEGRRLRTIGRRGEGPGEFTFTPSMGVVGDTLWTLERAFRTRVHLFRRSGEHLFTSGAINGVRVAYRPDQDGVVYPTVLRADGTFDSDMNTYTGRRQDSPPPADEGAEVQVPRLRFDVRGTVLDTVGWEVRPPPGDYTRPERMSIQGREYNIPAPAADRAWRFPVEDGWVEVHGEAPSGPEDAAVTVTHRVFGGDTAFHRVLHYAPEPYTEAYLDTLAWRGVRIPTGAYRVVNGQPEYPDLPDDAEGVMRTLRGAMDFPTYPPPLRSVQRMSDGSLWLLWTDTGGELDRWIVLAADGTPRGRLDLPRGSRPYWASGDDFVAVERDDFDVPWVVRYRLETGG